MDRETTIKKIRHYHQLKSFTPDYMINELNKRLERFCFPGYVNRYPHTSSNIIKNIRNDIEILKNLLQEKEHGK